MKFSIYLSPILGLLGPLGLFAANPIVPAVGLNDPHIKIFEGKAWVYASHDRPAPNETFVMDDWWVWSSPDLVHWKQECVIKPETTYIGKPFTGCWATDAAFRNGKYYFYFSEKNQRTGVLVGDTPAGPWRDPLGKPLLDSDLTPTDEYDMAVFQDEEGTPYIIFGVWDYYIARLNEDMISLAEQPRLLALDRKFGPYGEGKLDDKPDLHKANGHYYLSWGCFYAMADNIYGPYTYKGSVMDKDKSFAPGYAAPTWPNGPLQGRHGNFFTWHNQSYFTYCDISQTGNRYFRDAFISYVHYKANGEMALVRVDGIGVGEYHANRGLIEAEDYFAAEGGRKMESAGGGFVVAIGRAGGRLTYPNIHGLRGCTGLTFTYAAGPGPDRMVELREGSLEGKLIGRASLRSTTGSGFPQNVTVNFTSAPTGETLCLVFPAGNDADTRLDAFALTGPGAVPEPAYFSARPGALVEAKARLAAGDKTLQPALQRLIKEADAALRTKPVSVTEKTKPAPSGDPHDYASTAPYFWPDPSKPGGLPYIAHDGKVNPESRTAASDLNRIQTMGGNVHTLALAYYFTGKSAYAEHAARLLRTWFLDPATFMRPHLNYGQGIPGKNNGRNIGIIEGGELPIAGEAANLLTGSSSWSAQDAAGLKRWMNEYLDWLLNSDLGQQEAAELQNHGSLYDVQVMRLAFITGRTDLARQVAEQTKTKRIAVQIEPDGRQPLELRRTKAYNYSRLNLRGLTMLATLAERVGVDLWHYETSDGRSIRKAIDFMVPYVKTPPEPWPYQQIVKLERSDMAPMLRKAARAYQEPAYEKVVTAMSEAQDDIFQLLDPTPLN